MGARQAEMSMDERTEQRNENGQLTSYERLRRALGLRLKLPEVTWRTALKGLTTSDLEVMAVICQ